VIRFAQGGPGVVVETAAWVEACTVTVDRGTVGDPAADRPGASAIPPSSAVMAIRDRDPRFLAHLCERVHPVRAGAERRRILKI
jgi:hypothetical protein